MREIANHRSCTGTEAGEGVQPMLSAWGGDRKGGHGRRKVGKVTCSGPDVITCFKTSGAHIIAWEYLWFPTHGRLHATLDLSDTPTGGRENNAGAIAHAVRIIQNGERRHKLNTYLISGSTHLFTAVSADRDSRMSSGPNTSCRLCHKPSPSGNLSGKKHIDQAHDPNNTSILQRPCERLAGGFLWALP